jgi:hypothetical protein
MDFDLQDYSNEYIKDTYEFERNNPCIAAGMLVNVFDCVNPNDIRFIGKGRVILVSWDCFYHQYIADIELFFENRIVLTHAFANSCERIVGAELRLV